MSDSAYALGYDVVAEIAPATYELERTGDGVGYAFEMDGEAHSRLAGIARRAIPDSSSVERLEIEPGYIRVRLDVTTSGRRRKPDAYRAALNDITATYNERYATRREFDGLQLGDRYITTWRPDDRRTAADWVGTDDLLEDPVWEVTRDIDGQMRDRHMTHRVVLKVEPMEWDEHVLGRFEEVVEDRARWPTPMERVAVLDAEHVLVDLATGQLAQPPARLLERVQSGVASYNTTRPRHPEKSSAGRDVWVSLLELAGDLYVGTRTPPADHTVEAWIADRGLEDVDGAPVEPDTAPKEDASTWDALNPFGGA